MRRRFFTSLNDPAYGLEVSGFATPTINAATAARQTSLEVQSGIARSYSAWIRVSNMETSIEEAIINVSNSAATGHNCRLAFINLDTAASWGHLRFSVFDSSGNSIWIQSSDIFRKNRWTQVLIYYLGNNLSSGLFMFLNSVEDTAAVKSNTGTFTTPRLNADQRFRLGHTSAAIGFVGDIVDVCCWAGVMDQTKATALYAGGVPTAPSVMSFFGAQCVAYYPMRVDTTCSNNAALNLTNAGITVDFSEVNPFETRMSFRRAVLPSNGYMSFGNMIDIDASNLLWIGRKGTSHVAGGDGVRLPITKLGMVPGSLSTIINLANDVTGFSSELINGTIVEFNQEYNSGTDTFVKTEFRRSTDGSVGSAYSASTTVPNVRPRYDTYPRIIQGFQANEWLCGFFENTSGTDWTVALYQSLDDGVTWPNVITVYSGPLGFSECNFLNCGTVNGLPTIIGLGRNNEGSFGMYFVVSTDGGATWSAPAITNLGSSNGRSNCSMCLDDNGEIVVIYMLRDSLKNIYASRRNVVADIIADPTSFNTGIEILKSYGTDSLNGLFYSDIINAGGGNFYICTSLEFSASRADLWIGYGNFRYLDV